MKSHPHSWLGIGFFTTLFIGCLIFASLLIATENLPLSYLAILTAALAGTLGAAFVSYPTVEISTALKVAVNSYWTAPPTKKEVVDALLNLSLKSRADGLLALEGEEERVSVLFLRRALSMLVDGFTANELRETLNNETYFFQQRRAQHERIFRHLARLAIAFGFATGVGVVIGKLVIGGGNNAIDGFLPLVLSPIFCGLILANFLLIPVAESIYTKTHEELLILKLVMEGVTLIARDYNTLRLQTHLESFVAPQVRNIHHKSFEEIHEQYEKLRRAQLDQAG